MSFQQVQELFFQGQIVDALERIKTLKQLHEPRIILLNQLKLLHAEIQNELDNHDLAFSSAQEVLQVSEIQANPYLTAYATRIMADSLFRMGKIQDSIIILRQGETALDPMDQNTTGFLEARAFLKLTKGLILVSGQRNFTDSLAYLKESYSIFTQLNHSYGMIQAINSLGKYYNIIPDLTLALRYFNEGIDIAKEYGNDIEHYKFLSSLGNVYQSLGEIKTAQDYFVTSLELRQKSKLQNHIAQGLHSLGYIKIILNQFDEGIEHLQQSLKIRTGLNQKTYEIDSLSLLQVVYRKQGDLNNALDILQYQLKIAQEIGVNEGLIFTYYDIGEVFTKKGDLDKAIETYDEALSVIRKTDNKYWENMISGYKYRVFFLKGEIDVALEESKSVYEWFETEKYVRALIIGGQIIGQMYLAKKDIENALTYYDKSLTHIKNSNAVVEFRHFVFEIILDLIDHNYVKFAQEYLSRIQQLITNTDHKPIQLQFQLAEAIILKTSSRLKDKFKAQETLEELVEKFDQDNYNRSIAIFHLCELLSLEMQVSDDPEALLNEIQALTEKLLVKASQNRIYPQIIQGYVLNSQIALIQGNVAKAQDYLEQANTIAQDKGLNSLQEKVKIEQEKIWQKVKDWDRLTQGTALIKERIQELDLQSYFSKALKIQQQFK